MLCMLVKIPADDSLKSFFLIFPRIRLWHFNLHEMSGPIFREKIRHISLSCVELAQEW